VNEEVWADMVAELRSALREGDLRGAVPEAEGSATVGAVGLDTVIEAASGDPESQVTGYRALCDLLATRLAQGVNQVFGCLLIDGDPDPTAYAAGLDAMIRGDGTFTPVLPLSAEQARQLVDADVALFDVVDPATALIEIGASRTPVTAAVAQTALDEIDELIARHEPTPGGST
jgi:dihydrodipicolinate synthase/N-acetylneuraminate lyase